MRTAAIGLILSLLCISAINAAPETADTVFKNANIYTVNEHQPHAEAVAVPTLSAGVASNAAQLTIEDVYRLPAFMAPTISPNGQHFAVIMAVAAIAAIVAFPTATARSDEDIIEEVSHLRPAVWFGIAGISCMALTQAMMFSFLERIGIDRGFGREAVTGVLIALGFVNLFPAPLAARVGAIRAVTFALAGIRPKAFATA
jgi:hypothetical protein